MRKVFSLMLLLSTMALTAQHNSVRGMLIDSIGNPIAFANILAYETDSDDPISGATSNDDGSFVISKLEDKKYVISFSFIGFQTRTIAVNLPSEENVGTVTLETDTQVLDETLIVLERPTLIKESGKLVFNVENTSLSSGTTLNLLQRTPGVLVVQNRISVQNMAPTIYINDKRVYLSPAEVTSLLNNLDAGVVKAIEVITNTSSKYDAEAGTVLNIITTKAISVGYKASVSGRWEQAVFPKYNFTTSHFYKNDWINLYGSISTSPRKENKDQEDFIQFFQPDGSTKSIWESDFKRITRSNAHQLNIISDFTLSERNSLHLTMTGLISPDKAFRNTVFTEMFNAQQVLDSTFATKSDLENDSSNLSFNLEHTWKIAPEKTTLKTAVNFIRYDHEQIQTVDTQYELPDGSPLTRNQFFTNSSQDTKIFTGQMDATTPLKKYTLEAGAKFSTIHTDSKLDFFNTDTGIQQFNTELSDEFLYKEIIFANYINLSRNWDAWQFSAGLRSEYTDVEGDSRNLGLLNTQSYFELFPSVNVQHDLNENHKIGLTYARRVERPRYQSLNPFKYFLNENNFNGGNPNLSPSIENKVALSYTYKNTWFFELYYQVFDNALSVLTFQDNENNTLRNIDANLITDFQYSFDAIYASAIEDWWYLSVVTSTFYLENEFLSEESALPTYSNDTFGFYSQVYSGFTLSKKQQISSDITAVYLSNLIYGSYDYTNQFNLSLSFRKALLNDRASISLGVDDVFDTYNIPVQSKYYNQNNRYFSMAESRMFRLGFKFNFGNARLKDNNRSIKPVEAERLQ